MRFGALVDSTFGLKLVKKGVKQKVSRITSVKSHVYHDRADINPTRPFNDNHDNHEFLIVRKLYNLIVRSYLEMLNL